MKVIKEEWSVRVGAEAVIRTDGWIWTSTKNISRTFTGQVKMFVQVFSLFF